VLGCPLSITNPLGVGFPSLRARPLTLQCLHMHLLMYFYIRNVDADARKLSIYLCVISSWMRSDARCLELPSYVRDMQGGGGNIYFSFFNLRRNTFL
jgi:hypothetical protein